MCWSAIRTQASRFWAPAAWKACWRSGLRTSPTAIGFCCVATWLTKARYARLPGPDVRARVDVGDRGGDVGVRRGHRSLLRGAPSADTHRGPVAGPRIGKYPDASAAPRAGHHDLESVTVHGIKHIAAGRVTR